jgi:hypothetical protein
MLVAIAASACAVLGVGAARASAAGVVTGFAVTPASTQAAGDPNVSEDVTFSSGDATNSVKDVTFALAPGLMGSVANVPATCSSAQLTANTCPAGAQIGSGVVTLNGTGHENASIYLMPAPSAGDVAGVGEVIEGTSVRGTGAFDYTTDAGGQQIVEIRLGIPQVSGEHVTEIVATINGTTADGKPLTRLPSSCSAATTSLSVDTYDGGTGSGQSSFTPTGCSSLGYAPSLSTAQVIRDGSDPGAEVVFSVSQPGAAIESATKSLALDTSSTLSLNDAADAACLAGSPCVIGTASATSPLVASSYLTGGTVTLGGSPATPSLTIAFPTPAGVSLSGTINPVTGAIMFPDDPDLPLSGLTLDIKGPAGGKAFTTTCAPGNAIATFTPQDGGADVTSAKPIAYENCPAPSGRPSPGPGSTPSASVPPMRRIFPGKPSAAGSISGLASGHPRLRIVANHGAKAPGIASIAIRPARGLSFRKCATTRRRHSCKGVSVSGASVKTVTLRGGRLVITLAKPSGRVSVNVTGPLLTASKSLQTQAREHKLETAISTVTVVDAKNKATTIPLTLGL